MTPIETLHDALLDGGLDAAQQAELRRLLADPEQRRAWRRLATFSGWLGEELSARGMRRPASTVPARDRARPRRWAMLAASAAALLLALIAGGWWAVAGRAAGDGGALVLTAGTVRVDGAIQVAGTALPSAASLVGDGDGTLSLADGTSCAWNGPLVVRREGSRRLALERGDLRIAVPTTGAELVVVTACATATARPGARLRIRLDGTTTRFGVDTGTVAVAAGDQRIVLGADQALLAEATGLGPAFALTPPASWAITVGDGAWGSEDWLGVVDGAGVRPQPDPALPSDDPRRLIQASADHPPGMVAVSPAAVVQLSIRSDRAGPMTVILVCKDSFTGEHLGNLVADVDLVGDGALQRIGIPLSAFTDDLGRWAVPEPGERATPAAVFSVLLQWWGDDLGSRVEAVAIRR